MNTQQNSIRNATISYLVVLISVVLLLAVAILKEENAKLREQISLLQQQDSTFIEELKEVKEDQVFILKSIANHIESYNSNLKQE